MLSLFWVCKQFYALKKLFLPFQAWRFALFLQLFKAKPTLSSKSIWNIFLHSSSLPQTWWQQRSLRYVSHEVLLAKGGISLTFTPEWHLRPDQSAGFSRSEQRKRGNSRGRFTQANLFTYLKNKSPSFWKHLFLSIDKEGILGCQFSLAYLSSKMWAPGLSLPEQHEDTLLLGVTSWIDYAACYLHKVLISYFSKVKALGKFLLWLLHWPHADNSHQKPDAFTGM